MKKVYKDALISFFVGVAASVVSAIILDQYRSPYQNQLRIEENTNIAPGKITPEGIYLYPAPDTNQAAFIRLITPEGIYLYPAPAGITPKYIDIAPANITPEDIYLYLAPARRTSEYIDIAPTNITPEDIDILALERERPFAFARGSLGNRTLEGELPDPPRSTVFTLWRNRTLEREILVAGGSPGNRTLEGELPDPPRSTVFTLWRNRTLESIDIARTNMTPERESIDIARTNMTPERESIDITRTNMTPERESINIAPEDVTLLSRIWTFMTGTRAFMTTSWTVITEIVNLISGVIGVIMGFSYFAYKGIRYPLFSKKRKNRNTINVFTTKIIQQIKDKTEVMDDHIKARVHSQRNQSAAINELKKMWRFISRHPRQK